MGSLTTRSKKNWRQPTIVDDAVDEAADLGLCKKSKMSNLYPEWTFTATPYESGPKIRPGQRVANFCAGPAHISCSVLQQMKEELLDYQGSGMGIIEHSHREVGGTVQTSLAETCALLREVLSIPENYEVLLMQGGAHAQFAALPLNLLRGKKKAAYVDGGFWSQRAAGEAKKYCEVEMIEPLTTNEAGEMIYPPASEWKVPEGCAYVHICANETINGMEFREDPAVGTFDCPLVADFTSTLLSRPVDVSKYGVIYSSGGKNLGPAGHCVVIIRKDLLGQEMSITPGVLSYSTYAMTTPIPNIWHTPNMFAARALQLVVMEVASYPDGLPGWKKRAEQRSKVIYNVIDSSDGFYTNTAAKEWRSNVTIPFRIMNGREDLEAKFTKEAALQNMHFLNGHHTVGGLRVCVYNSIPDRAVKDLLAFMIAFQLKNAPKTG